ncbi:hypothetical protein D6C80_07932 [Aureobasidium pullulans]|nr:hypothetical protein D6C80_07932 [Aureobasidium pullulans]
MAFVYPECILPAEPLPRFVGAARFRSTADILWYCLVPITISVWSVQRPNAAPAPTPKDPRWWKRFWQKHLSRPATQFLWMCIMLAAPDIVFARATANVFAAWQNNRVLKRLAVKDGVEWSFMHTMTANMGGIRIVFDRPIFDEETSYPGPYKPLAEDARSPDARHAKRYRGASQMETEVRTLDSRQLIKARHRHVINHLPNISSEELDDKNKSSFTVLFGAVVPLIYAALQFGARRYQNLPSALLEIETVAFVTCAFSLYFVDIRKPMDLNVPFDFPASEGARMRSIVAQAAPKPMMGWGREYKSPRITNGSIPQTKYGSRLSYDVMNCALISMAVLFGGIHLFAWDYKFPTEIEQLLWRIATLSAMFLPVLWVFVVQLESLLPPKDQVKKLIGHVRWVTLAPPHINIAKFGVGVESTFENYGLEARYYGSIAAFCGSGYQAGLGIYEFSISTSTDANFVYPRMVRFVLGSVHLPYRRTHGTSCRR